MNTNLKGYSFKKFIKKMFGIELCKFQIKSFKEFYFEDKKVSQPFAHPRRR
jgi:hypothetical protein